MMRRPASPRRQRGVAIVTALLLTTLAVTIVASLFWQQQVQVRSMENQRLQLQTRWIVRGALDYARLILRQDGADRGNRTTLDGVWTTPLAETRLDQYIERERVEQENFNATIAGRITDAESRYNLANLASGRQVSAENVLLFQRLLSNLRLDTSLAQRTAEEVARSQKVLAPPAQGPQGQSPSSGGNSGAGSASGTASGSGTGTGSGSGPASQPQVSSDGRGEPMELQRVEDLLAVSGFTPQAVERLRDFVIVLPQGTPLNVNTVPAEVLSALVSNLSLSEAESMVNVRKRASYLDINDFTSKLGGRPVSPAVQAAVRSDNFLVLSQVKLDRATLDTQALIHREPASGNFRTTVVWIRDN